MKLIVQEPTNTPQRRVWIISPEELKGILIDAIDKDGRLFGDCDDHSNIKVSALSGAYGELLRVQVIADDVNLDWAEVKGGSK